MKQYNIHKHLAREYFVSEGLPNTIFEPGKRKSLSSPEEIVNYLDEIVPEKKKVEFRIDSTVPIDLESRLKQLRPKAIVTKTEFRRGVPPPATDLNQ